MKVSVILPIRNEADFIERSLGSVLAQSYPKERVQVLVADGHSDDGTVEKIRTFIARHPERDIRFIDNPAETASTGFNLALAEASGDIIIRVDGHCEIAPNYVHQCIRGLEETNAECVGGALETVGETVVARSIALAQSSRFGVGGAAFRTGGRKGRYVDTLAFGAYRREVFDRLGGYDEELIRNQDDELNFRITQSGGRIWFEPSIRAVYYSRASLHKLWRQYYQYGLYKVRVAQKRRGVASWRHLVPAIFVLGVITSVIAAAAFAQPLLTLPVLGTYALANLAASVWTGSKNWRTLPILPVAFATLHFAYGAGFLTGLWRWRKKWGDSTPVTKEFSEAGRSVQSIA